MQLNIDNTTKEIFDKLALENKTYIVGGYIRDSLLGIESKDVDIATSLDINTVLNVLKEYKPSITNEKYQIVCVRIDDRKYEIARLREESGILDGRNPKNFNFTNDIYIDLKRRDFTINAFAYDGKNIIDEYNSTIDLNNRLIKVIGNSYERLLEDRIRILRAFRFMARLDFNFDKDLEKSIIKLSQDKKLFLKISKERLILEFNQILLSPFAYKALLKMFELGILKYFIQEFDNRIYKKEIFELICSRYKNLTKKNKKISLELAYATIFSFSAKKSLSFEKLYENDSIVIFEKFIKKFSTKNTEYFNVKSLIYYHSILFKNPSLIMLKRMLLDLVNNKNVAKLINLMSLLYPENTREIKHIYYNIQGLYMADEPVFLSDIDIQTVDLFNLNLTNKNYTEIKLSVFADVLKGKVANEKYDILNSILNKYKIKKSLKFEKSAGAVVFRNNNGRYEFLIIQGINEGSYGFPKGHIEIGEKDHEAAIREVKEETNIVVAIIDKDKFRESLKYIIAPNIYKEVELFLAVAKNHDIVLDDKEIKSAKWYSYNEARSILTFSQQRKILKKAMLYIYKDER